MFAECWWLFGCVLSPIVLPLSATRPVWPVSPVCSDLCPTPHPVIRAAAELDLMLESDPLVPSGLRWLEMHGPKRTRLFKRLSEEPSIGPRPGSLARSYPATPQLPAS